MALQPKSVAVLSVCVLLFFLLAQTTARSHRSKRQADSVCVAPANPAHGRFQCVNTDHGAFFDCTATCDSGYRFVTQEASVKRRCDMYGGFWQDDPKDVPGCMPVCSQPCQNGGTCTAPGTCACADGFHGAQCQTRAADGVCSDLPKPDHGRMQCAMEGREKLCFVRCEAGYTPGADSARVYRCQAGVWSPSSAVPPCVKSLEVIVRTSEPDPPPTKKTVPGKLPKSSVHPPPAEAAACTAWGQDHYRTFDNRLFTFRGTCEYLLVRDCRYDTFDIHVINDDSCNADGASPNDKCKREVDVYLGTTTKIQLRVSAAGDPEVTWNSETLLVPMSRDGVVIEKVGGYLTVHTAVGVMVKWDGKQEVTVKVSEELKNGTCGLCGRFDNDPENDLEDSTGHVLTSVAPFADSWKRSALGDTCPGASQKSRCQTDTPEHRQSSLAAQSRCAQIANDTAFQPCHQVVDPALYVEACTWDCCGQDSDQCTCNTMQAYSRACMDRGVTLTWRRPDRCSVTCRRGKEFQECGSSCTRTCGAPTASCKNQACVDGCFCPAGTVLHGGVCIAVEQCPCAHADKDYRSGETMQLDCNTCTCRAGKWNCTNNKCSSTCAAVGGPHYVTFDGTRYDFTGTCSYYLQQDKDYSVTIDNIECAQKDTPCIKSVTIDFNKDIIRLDRNHQLTVNGRQVKTLPLHLEKVKVFMVSSLFMQVDLSNGLSILWDGRMRVYVSAPPSLLGKTRGLCGTFDKDQHNDFLTLDGDTETNVNAFGNRWKTDPTCRDTSTESAPKPCESNAQRLQQAEQLCQTLKADLFKPCHGVEDVQSYYQNCLYDICGCEANLQDCLCPSLGQYADTCASLGVMVNWRLNVSECALTCPGGQEYQVCGNPCERTCTNMAAARGTCSPRCVEGCNCPDGEALNQENACMAVSLCPCMFDGREFAPGFTARMGSKVCTCMDAQWDCAAQESDAGEVDVPTVVQDLCPPTMHYSDCPTLCPLTCDSLDIQPTCSANPGQCKPGCTCNEGLVLENGICVEATMCPCHHGGHAYFEGDTILKDCNKCTCQSRKWQCEKQDCPGMCSAVGDSHYTTFDGREYQFQGSCDYVLVRSRHSGNQSFLVTTENVACGTSGVTCSKMVELAIGEPGTASFYSVQMVRGLPVTEEPGSPIKVRTIGRFVHTDTPFGLSLQWDQGTRVYIKLATHLRGQVQGLCGNFNGDQKDDFTTPQGGPPAVRATTFGDSWKMHAYCADSKEVEDTCALAPHRKPWAQKKCGVLASDLFRPCHAVEPYAKYMEKCVFDACACDQGGDCECMCTAIAAYAHICATKGVQIKWRKNGLCAMECEDCQTYNPCITGCPPKTCLNRLVYTQVLAECHAEGSTCSEGCDLHPCPEGQVYDSLTPPVICIPEPLCETPACEVNGKLYRDGERVEDNSVCNQHCEICNCRGGQIEHISFGYCTHVTPARPITVSTSATTPIGGRTLAPTPTHGPTLTPAPGSSPGPSHTPTTNLYTASSFGTSVPPVTPGNVTSFTYTVTPSVGSTPRPVTGSVTTGTPMPPRCTQGWTPWMSSYTPTLSNVGDLETLTSLRLRYSFCPEVDMESIECRVVGENTRAQSSGQQVTCRLPEGLVCRHVDQAQGTMCKDYELRFSCNCGGVPTSTGETFSSPPEVTPSGATTPSPSPGGQSRPTVTPPGGVTTEVPASRMPFSCTQGWTDWINTDKPSVPRAYEVEGEGDYETLPEVRLWSSFCAKPTAIRCREVQSKTPAHLSTAGASCNLDTGLICVNEQAPNGQCPDFEVGFQCDCGQGATPTQGPYPSPSESTVFGEVTGSTESFTGTGTVSTLIPGASPSKGPHPTPSESTTGGEVTGSTETFTGTGKVSTQIPGASPSEGPYPTPSESTTGGEVTGSTETFTGTGKVSTKVPGASPTQEPYPTPESTVMGVGTGSTETFTGTGQVSTEIPGASPTKGPHPTPSGSTPGVEVTGSTESFTGTGTVSTLIPGASPTKGPYPSPSESTTGAVGTGSTETFTGTGKVPGASPTQGPYPTPESTVIGVGTGSTETFTGTETVSTLIPGVSPSKGPYPTPAESTTGAVGTGSTEIFTGTGKVSTAIPGASPTHGPYPSPSESASTTVGPEGTATAGPPGQSTPVVVSGHTGGVTGFGTETSTVRPEQVTSAFPSVKPPLSGEPWAYLPSCMWTPWMNSDRRTPNSAGDLETISNLRMSYPFCEHPVEIECRVASDAVPTSMAGVLYNQARQLGISCDLNRGLTCLDASQANGDRCLDYEVRVYCVDACPSTPSVSTQTASEPSKKPGFTTETESPTTKKPGFEGSTMEFTQTPPAGSTGPVSEGSPSTTPSPGPEGRPTGTPPGEGTFSTSTPGEGQRTSTISEGGSTTEGGLTTEGGSKVPPGLKPTKGPEGVPELSTPAEGTLTSTPGGKQEISTAAEGGPTPGRTPTKGPGAPEVSTPQEGWFTSWFWSSTETAPTPVSGGTGSTVEVPKEGGSTQKTTEEGGSTPGATPSAGPTGRPHVTTAETGQTESTKKTAEEGGSTPKTTGMGGSTPKTTEEGGSTPGATPSPGPHGQPPLTTPGTGLTESTPQGFSEGVSTPSQPKQSSPTPSPACLEGWTPWINSDRPENGNGDIERLQGLPGYPRTCWRALTAECRVAESGKDYRSLGQLVTCDKTGLECISDENQTCADYEVRFYCLCEPTPTTPLPSGQTPTMTPSIGPGTTPSVPVVPGSPPTLVCSHGWTPYMNTDRPGGADGGDLETMARLRQAASFCAEFNIVAVDCIEALSGNPAAQSGQRLMCDKMTGLMCLDGDQLEGECLDYAVRFYCDCLHTTQPAQTTVSGFTGQHTLQPTGTPTEGPNATPTMGTQSEGTTQFGFETTAYGQSSSPSIGGNTRETVSPPVSPTSKPEATPTGEVTGTSGGSTAPPGVHTTEKSKLTTPSGSGTTGQEFGSTGTPGVGETVTPPPGGKTPTPGLPFEGSTMRYYTGQDENGPTSTPSGATPGVTSGVSPTLGPSASPPIVPATSTVKQPLVKTTAVVETGTTQSTFVVTQKVCNETLGVRDPDLIPKDQLTASSSFDYTSEADRARLDNTDSNGLQGAWVARSADKGQWIQVDLKRLELLTGVVTQGHPSKAFWVTAFTLSTSVDGVTFTPYVERGQTEPTVFQGNSDQNSKILAHLDREVPARIVRILPLSWNQAIALRFDVLGCTGTPLVMTTASGETTAPSAGPTSKPPVTPLSPGETSSTSGETSSTAGETSFTTKKPSVEATPLIPGETSSTAGETPSGVPTRGPTVTPYGPVETSSTAGETPSGVPTHGPKVTPSSPVETSSTVGETSSTTGQPSGVPTKKPGATPLVTGGTASTPAGPGETSATTKMPSGVPTKEPQPTPYGPVETSSTAGETSSASVPFNATGVSLTGFTIPGAVTRATATPPGETTAGPSGPSTKGPGPTPEGEQTTPISPTGVTTEPGASPTAPGQISSSTPMPTGATAAPQCDVPMGVDNSAVISDKQLSASSSAGPDSLPSAGRLFNYYGSWMPSVPDGNQWLQVDLGRPVPISSVLTQGAPDSGRYVTYYVLRYSNDGLTFTTYSATGDNNPTNITANTDSNKVVKFALSPPITARYWRLVPTAWSPEGIALRFTLLGCIERVTPPPVEGGAKNITGYVTPTGYVTTGAVTSGTEGSVTPTARPSVTPTGESTVTLSSVYTGSSSYKTPTGTPTPSPTLEPLCTKPMGVENYRIVSDDQLTSSSKLDKEHGATYGRLVYPEPTEPTGWIPDPKDNNPWLQVDLREPKMLSAIILHDLTTSSRFVLHFSLDGNTFTPYTESRDDIPRTFYSRTGQGVIQPQYFNRNIIFRYVRIVSVDGSKFGGIRFNVLGCNPSVENPAIPTREPETTTKPFTGEPGQSTETPTGTTTAPLTVPPVCLTPMGVSDRYVVHPNQIIASSTLDVKHPAESGRLYNQPTTGKGDAWAPKLDDDKPWIQVDLLTPKLISGIVTQGSTDLDRWVTKFTISYSLDLVTFTPYTDQPGDATPKVFDANTDAATPVRNLFDRDVIARAVRVHLVEGTSDGMALRLDVLGCNPDPPRGTFAQPTPPPGTGVTNIGDEVTPTPTEQWPNLTPDEEPMCDIPMGVDNPNIIQDLQLRASSCQDSKHCADRSRLYTQRDGPLGGAWQPSVSDNNQWIEVDFLAPYPVSGVSTQGSSELPYWVTQYEVHTSTDGSQFYPVKENGTTTARVFDGNVDQWTPVRQIFPKVISRYVRLRPLEYNGGIALRFNVYGCEPPVPMPHRPPIITYPPTMEESTPGVPSEGKGTTESPLATPTRGPTVSPGTGTGQTTESRPTSAIHMLTGSSSPIGSTFETGTGPSMTPTSKPGVSPSHTTQGETQSTEKQPSGPSMQPTKQPHTPYTTSTGAQSTEAQTRGPSGEPTRQPTVTPSAPEFSLSTTSSCLYWSPWFVGEPASDVGQVVSYWDMAASLSVCQSQHVKNIQCRAKESKLPSDQTGQDVACDLQSLSFLCENSPQQTCLTYEIRVFCDECGATTTSSPFVTPPKHEKLPCKTKWSSWINRDKNPSDGDREVMSQNEMSIFCPGGSLTKVECNSADGRNQPSYMASLATECDVTSGFTCDAERNKPLPCQDFRVRYYCQCPEIEVTETPATPETGTTGAPGTQTSTSLPPGHTNGPTPSPVTGIVPEGTTTETPPPVSTCTQTGWSVWLNRDTPGVGDGDREFMTQSELTEFCIGGAIDDVDCETAADVPHYLSGEKVQCDVATGLTCKNTDNFPSSCSDYKIRYHCKCPQPTKIPMHSTLSPETVTPTMEIFSTNVFQHNLTSWHASQTTWATTKKGETPGITPTSHPSMEPTVTFGVGHTSLGTTGEFGSTMGPEGTPTVGPSGTPTLGPSGTPTQPPEGTPGIHVGTTQGVSGSTVTGEMTPSGTPTARPPGTPTVSEGTTQAGAGTTVTVFGEITPKGTPTARPSGTPGLPYETTFIPSNVTTPQEQRTSFPGVPSATPSAIPPGTPSGPYSPVSSEATPSGTPGVTPVVTRCSKSSWTPWVNKDTPETGGGDYEQLTRDELSVLCTGGSITKVECYAGDTPAAAMGELVGCTLERGVFCNNDDNKDNKCSDYKIRYFCDCQPETTATTEKPTTAKPPPKIYPMCTWSPWLNADRPRQSPDDQGDLETIDLLKTTYGLCPNITEVQCRVAGTSTPADNSVTCDAQNGLRCYNKEQLSGTCYDYQIRVLCWSPLCKGPVPTPPEVPPLLETTEYTPEARTTVACQAGFEWRACAFPCGGVCDYMARSSGACDDATGNGCVPGCAPVFGDKTKCPDGQKLLDSGTCVPTALCTCLKPDGTEAKAYETWENPADACSQCSCFNGAVRCVHDQTCTTVAQTTQATPTAQAGMTTPQGQQVCGWSRWLNMDKPSSVSGDVESIARAAAEYGTCSRPLRVECRDVSGKVKAESTGQVLTCDTFTGLTCHNADNTNPCRDYEIRVYCVCAGQTGTIPTGEYETTPTGPGGTFRTSVPINYDENPTSTPSGFTGSTPEGTSAPPGHGSSVPPGFGTSAPPGPAKSTGFTITKSTSSVSVTSTPEGLAESTPEGLSTLMPTGSAKSTEFTTVSGASTPEGRTTSTSPSAPKTSAPPLGQESSPKVPLEYTTTPQPVCGWTSWMTSQTPDPQGEQETIPSLRSQFQFCATEDITAVDCRERLSQASSSKNPGVFCDLRHSGLICRQNNMSNEMTCPDYEVRFLCEPKGLDCNLVSLLQEYHTTSGQRPTTGVTPEGEKPTPHPEVSPPEAAMTTPGETGSPSPGGQTRLTGTPPGMFSTTGTPELTPSKGPTMTPSGATTATFYESSTGSPIPGEQTKKTVTPPGMYSTTGTSGELTPSKGPTMTPTVGTTATVYESSTGSPSPGAQTKMTVTPPGMSEGTTLKTVNVTPTQPSWDSVRVCADPMQDARFLPMTKSQLEASSALSRYTGPERAPLHTTQQGPFTGAWIASSKDLKPWIAVHFQDYVVITGLVTQGRDVFRSWVTSYNVMYSVDGHRYYFYEEKPGVPKVFTGNNDTYTEVRHILQPTTARHFTIQPIDWYNNPSLRFALLGCLAPAGSVNPTPTPIPGRNFSTPNPVPTPAIPEVCMAELGMMSGQIRDSMISASSFRDTAHAPTKARLDGSGTWLTARDDLKQYIQVDLLGQRYVTAVTTQGRPDAASYVTTYKVLYSTDGVNWNALKETADTEKVFNGNSDSSTPVTNVFQQPIRARFVRINPVTWEGRIALRFELHGCFEPYPTETPPVPGEHVTTSIEGVTGVTRVTVTPVPGPIPDNCITWDDWVDTAQPNLTNSNDVETLEHVKAATRSCRDPLAIECRTAGPDHTPAEESGQDVRCSLWDGLVCEGAEQVDGLCLDYQVRLGCLKQTPECLSAVPTPTGVTPCYPGLDMTSCPATCPMGTLCDGSKCVLRSACPCQVDAKVIKASQVTQNSKCETCQCLNGGLMCLSKTCPPCLTGPATVNSTTCDCQCPVCEADQFQCSNGQCIPTSARCDGVTDCVDDEFTCAFTPAFTPPTTLAATTQAHTTVKVTPPGMTPTAQPSGSPSVEIITQRQTTYSHNVQTTTFGTLVSCESVTCPPLVEPALRPGFQAVRVRSQGGCCEEYMAVCQPSLCPHNDVLCLSPLVARQMDNEECCPTYDCVCPDVCPEPVTPTCALGLQVVEIKEECNCTRKACLATPVLTPTPAPKKCLYVPQHFTQNLTRSPPIPEIHGLGSVWEDGPCCHCQCVGLGDDNSPEIKCDLQVCPSCKTGEERVEKEGACCGECRPIGCVVDGVVYKAGDIIPSSRKCFMKTCTIDQSRGTPVVQETQKECVRLSDLPPCAQDETGYDAQGCCLECVPPSLLPNVTSASCKTCSPHAVFAAPQESVGYFTDTNSAGAKCSNTDPVTDMAECSGFCGSSSTYTAVMGVYSDTCTCCQPTRTDTRHVELKCGDGTTITHNYEVAQVCACGACTKR